MFKLLVGFALLSSMAISSSANSGGSQPPFDFEVNVGPIPFEFYDQINGTTLPSCSATKPVRTCFQEMLSNYTKQGVTGIRFMFDINGPNFPMQADGTPSATWLAQVAEVFSDIKASGILKITPTPNWGGWGNNTDLTVLDPCTNQNVQLHFYRSSPYGFDMTNGYPYTTASGQQDYNCAPANPIFVGWKNIYNLFDAVLALAQNNQLSVSEFDLQNEINVNWFPVMARLIVDNKHTSTGDPNIYANVRALMTKHGYKPDNVTYSVSETNTSVGSFDCTSPYGDSGRLVNLSALIAAIQGQPFGHGKGWNVQNKLICGGNKSGMTQLSVQQVVPKIFDVHSYDCVETTTGGCDPTKFDENAADIATLFTGAAGFIQAHGSMQDTEYMIGETFSTAYKNQATSLACENVNIPSTILSQMAAALAASPLAKTLGRSPLENAIRPWNYIMDTSGCYSIYQQIPL